MWAGLANTLHCPIFYAVGEGVEPDWRLGEIGLEHWFRGDQYIMAGYSLVETFYVCTPPGQSSKKTSREQTLELGPSFGS